MLRWVTSPTAILTVSFFTSSGGGSVGGEDLLQPIINNTAAVKVMVIK